MATEDKRIITKAELEVHNNGKSTWISIHDRVYDCTKFLEEVIIKLVTKT